MVDLGGKGEGSPLQHSFDNTVFIVPALIILGVVGKKLCLRRLINVLFDRIQTRDYSGPMISAAHFCAKNLSLSMDRLYPR